ncbi:uncharacterized protein FIBRA_06038 [Fibroporia radiculosa]|uniref:Uncharacterized protein n=1 Tax=Fibroporia radiculosa TaxID=599839 RepID=J4HYH9_9APHY|nr:uncharacterized protein FIBRA_06038 [Fibroporia radiculosa]CCM03887.1 predicted protein [Fibroporia radiculosa]
MDERSQEDQERDMRDMVRRTEKMPNKTSGQRRDALKRLIDLAHSPYPKLKILAAAHLKNYIKDFPDLEDDAINAVYDLCEDPVTNVRISGYRAIVDVSMEQPKWVKRNADVLVQLLQSDEPEEVSVVKRALCQHLDLNPAVTLGVLCDQIVPADESMDDEEVAIRNRLRSLVLSFITGEAKRAIIERHTSIPGGAAEEALVSGLLRGIAKLTPVDAEILVKDILVSIPSFKPASARGKELLEAILDRAKVALKADLLPGSERVSLQQTRYYLELSSYVAVEKHIAQPSQLLRFYFTSMTSKMILMRLNEEAQLFVISHVADVLSAYEERPPQAAGASDADTAMLRRQIPDVCVLLLQVFSEANSAERKPWKACIVFLRACERNSVQVGRAFPSNEHPSKYPVTRNISNHLCPTIFSSLFEQSLIPSASKPQTPTASVPTAGTTDVSQGATSSSSNAPAKFERRIMNVKRKNEDRSAAGLPPKPQTSLPPSIHANGGPRNKFPEGDRQRSFTPQARQRASTVMGDAEMAQNSRPTSPEDQPRAAKRAKKGGGSETNDIPSLLSRMASTSSNGHSAIARERERTISAPGRGRIQSAAHGIDRSRPINSQDVDKDPVGGYSIKGAAKAAEHDSPPRSQLPSTSLLDRIQKKVAGREAGEQRKKNWTKT